MAAAKFRVDNTRDAVFRPRVLRTIVVSRRSTANMRRYARSGALSRSAPLVVIAAGRMAPPDHHGVCRSLMALPAILNALTVFAPSRPRFDQTLDNIRIRHIREGIGSAVTRPYLLAAWMFWHGCRGMSIKDEAAGRFVIAAAGSRRSHAFFLFSAEYVN